MEILVIAPHPDDEIIGPGGTLLKQVADGARVTCIHVTNSNRVDPEALRQHMGISTTHNLGFKAGQIDHTGLGLVIDRLAACLGGLVPDQVYLPFPGDAHSDHRVAFEAAYAYFKPFRRCPQAIYCYEVLSSTEVAPPLSHRSFQPNFFEDIEGYLEAKVAAFQQIYPGEVLPPPAGRNGESLRALARVRGCQVNLSSAEAFMILRAWR